MYSSKKYAHPFLFLILGSLSLLVLQSAWVFHAYEMKYRHLINETKEAFDQAYQKEQTYRIPVVDIVNSGEVTIQGCGNEEIIIVRNCFNSDTIIYNNVSGHSVESFINHVFWDLREQIVPMNIYCLADLFAGMLHDRSIPASFIIERYNIKTGEILETSFLPGNKQLKMNPETTIVSEISDKEAIRVILQIVPGIVFGNMTGILAGTICLVVVVLLCMVSLYCYRKIQQNTDKVSAREHPEQVHNNIFQIGQYCFDPGKNELQGFGEIIQLNKKENAILYALCQQHGNVVERSVLLEENWGSSGIVYTRSLDTYFTTLRKYLKKDPSIQIVTVKGVGYKLVCLE